MGNSFMKAFIVLALSILQTTVCYADTFKGKVVNAETGEVIVGARVESEINPPNLDGLFRVRQRPTVRDASI